MDVEEHSDSEKQLVVVSVEMFPVTLIKEHLGVKFLLLGPRGSVRDGASSGVLGLFALATSGHGCVEAGVTLGHLGASKFLGGDQVPHESLDVLVPGVPLEAVHKRESDSVLKLFEMIINYTNKNSLSCAYKRKSGTMRKVERIKNHKKCSFSISMACSSFLSTQFMTIY